MLSELFNRKRFQGFRLGTARGARDRRRAVRGKQSANAAFEPLEGRAMLAVLVGWDVNGQSKYGTSPLAATETAAGISVTTGLTRGAGVGTSGSAAGNAWGGNNWNTASEAAALSGNDVVTFSVQVAAGKSASFSDLAINYRRSRTGPPNGQFAYQLGAGAFTNAGTSVSYASSSSSGGLATVSLTGVTGLQDVAAGTTVTFRLANWGASSSGGTWYISNRVTGSDLILNGEVSDAGPVVTAPTVTTGSATNLAATTVTLGGNITDNGGEDATERGIYYSTSNGFADGAGTKVSTVGTFGSGPFTQNVTGLTGGTTYYFKAFATNSAGTTYGSQVSFLTVPGTPATPTASSVTSSGFTVNWAATKGATRYRLDVSTTSNFSSLVSGYNNLTVNGTSRAVTGLSPGTTYYARVRAVNASGTGANSATLTRATVGVPVIAVQSPVGTAISSGGSRDVGTATVGSTADFVFRVANSGSANLSVTGITFGGTNSGDFSVVGSSTATIAAGGSQDFTIRFSPAAAGARTGSVTFANNSSPSSFVINLSGTGSAAAVAPTVTTSAASSLAATAATLNGAVNADGGAAVTERGFVYSTSNATPVIGQGGTTKAAVSGTTGELTEAVTGLTANTLVYFRAFATNSVGTTYGDVQNFTTLKAQPTAHVTPLTWTAASPQPDGYLVLVGTSIADPTDGTPVADDTNVSGGGAVNLAGDLAGDATSYSGFTGFAAGTDYTFKVIPYNNSGDGIDYFLTSAPTVTGELLPAAPATPTFASVTATGFTVNWGAVTGADSYRLDVSTASDFATFVSGYQDLTVAGTSQAVTGLAANTQYYARVRAVNTAGTGANSTAGTQTTSQLPAPTTEAASDITASGFTANWNAVAGATGYELTVSSASAGSTTTETFTGIGVVISRVRGPAMVGSRGPPKRLAPTRW